MVANEASRTISTALQSMLKVRDPYPNLDWIRFSPDEVTLTLTLTAHYDILLTLTLTLALTLTLSLALQDRREMLVSVIVDAVQGLQGQLPSVTPAL